MEAIGDSTELPLLQDTGCDDSGVLVFISALLVVLGLGINEGITGILKKILISGV